MSDRHVARHPLVQALWLEARNRIRSSAAPGGQKRLWLALFALAGSMGVAITALARFVPSLLQEASVHMLTVSVLVALLASILVHRGRRKWTDVYASNWLSTLPIARGEVTRMVALRSCLAPGLGMVLLMLVVLIACMTARGANGTGPALLVSIGIAGLVGALLGWFLPHRDRGPPRPVLLHGTSQGARTDASLASLSTWATSQAKLWLQPRLLARILLPAMLALPMDVSANVAIALLTVWAIGIYLCVLLRATVEAARNGAAWLRPTPLSFRRFAWAIARTPVLKQVQWTLVAAVFLIALGCKPLWAVRAAEWWLALVTVTSGITIAQAHRSGAWRMRLLLSVSALALLERVRQHAALAGALIISAWHFRKAARA